jgi:biotin synthase
MVLRTRFPRWGNSVDRRETLTPEYTGAKKDVRVKKTFSELEAIYRRPLFELLQESRRVHSIHWPENEMQLCTLLSVKTGGCSEDCSYCAQSGRYHTGLSRERLMTVEEVLPHARRAKANGSTRFCMGAAWKGVRDGDQRFERVLETVREVSKLGMEVFVTLGQLGDAEARKLKRAGVTAYNHNIDTASIIQNRVHSYLRGDRLATITPAACGNERLLRRNRRHGETERPPADAGSALPFDPRRKSPHQLPRSDARHSFEHCEPVDTFELAQPIGTT